MNKLEINEFMEQMEEIGDVWTVDQVKDVYGDYSLEDALSERRIQVGMLFENIGRLINRKVS